MEKLQAILPGVLNQIQNPETGKRRKLVENWSQIAGEALAKKTQAKLTESRTLVIWVAESALAAEIQQRYKTTLLKRVQALLGENEVTAAVVRVGQLR